MALKSISGVFSALLISLGMVFSANVALLSSDLIQNTSDGLLSVGTATKLEWLDLTETVSYS